jgi:hypothetical protein
MGKLDGHCLCGQVTYTCDAEPIISGICHCTECRRQSGSAWSMVVGVERDSIEIKGESLGDFVTIGTDSESPVHRHFCTNCGSPIVSLPEWSPDVAFIKAGTLDDPTVVEPELEAWCESAVPWSGMDQSREDRGFFPRGLDTEGDDDEEDEPAGVAQASQNGDSRVQQPST